MAFLEISTILQAQTQVAATTQEFSFWKIMFTVIYLPMW
jgi:biopolymer transport protein ExbB